MKSLGVGTDSSVICYDSSQGQYAAKIACLLSSYGVKQVHVLSGSFKTWCPKSEQPLSQSTTAISE